MVEQKRDEAKFLAKAIKSGGQIQTNKGGVIHTLSTEEATRMRDDAVEAWRSLWNDLVDEARVINSAAQRKRFTESMAPKN